MPKPHLLALALSQAWATNAMAGGAIIVTTNADELNTNGECSLREALTNIAGTDQSGSIDCDSGAVSTSILLPASQTLTLSSALPELSRVSGIFGSDATLTRDGSCNLDGTADVGEFRLLTVAAGSSLSISNLTLTNGCADGAAGAGDGGGIYAANAYLSLNAVVLDGNSAFADGGGLVCRSSASDTCNTTGVTFQNNRAGNGGGMFAQNVSSTLQSTNFIANTASGGGGLLQDAGQITHQQSYFSQNVATGDGGAIQTTNVTVAGLTSINRSLFVGNTATRGGAAFLGGLATVSNSTVSGNSASTYGGGFYLAPSAGSLTLVESSLVDNAAGTAGGLLRSTTGNATSITRSLLVSDSGTGCSGAATIVENISSITTDASCVQTSVTQQTRSSLELGVLADNGGPLRTHAIGRHSTALDTGGAACTSIDARELTRPIDGDNDASALCDVGAFEFQDAPQVGPDFVVTQLDDADDGQCTDGLGGCSLREAIDAANANSDASVITFDPSVFATPQTMTLTLYAMSITQPTTITGPGADMLTIDANLSSNHFFVNIPGTGNVTLTDLRLINGSNSDGGSISSSDGLRLERMTLEANTASNAGGALSAFVFGAYGVSIVDSKFLSNRGTTGTGGAATIGVFGSGGATITGSTFSDNSNFTAGALSIDGNSSPINISDSTFSNNTATCVGGCAGGGIELSCDSNIATLQRLQVTGNTATSTGVFAYGGGIAMSSYSGCEIRLSESTIANNAVYNSGGESFGGGIHFESNGGSLQVERSTISGNSAQAYGGGLYLSVSSGATSTIRNSTVSGNSVDGYGGGLLTRVGNVSRITLENSTVTQNVADADNDGTGGGGGLALYASSVNTVSLQGTLIANNQDLNGGAAPDIQQNDRNLVLANSIVGDNAGTTLTEAQVGSPGVGFNLIGSAAGGGAIDPLLGPLADNGGNTFTHLPDLSSPAVDHYFVCSGTDQRNVSRRLDADGVAGNDCDVGAVEVITSVMTPGTLAVNSFDGDTDGSCDPKPAGDCTLLEAISVANANADLSEITFDPAFIPSSATLSLGSALPVLTESTTITGSGQTIARSAGLTCTPNGTQGAGEFSLLRFNNAAATLSLSNLTVTGGCADGAGGAGRGGALNATAASVSLSLVNVLNNTAQSGGGLYLFGESSGSLAVSESRFQGNKAVNGSGGGIQLAGVAATISETLLQANTASAQGGAVKSNRSLSVQRSAFSGNNSGSVGGAIHAYGSLTLTNSTISGNSATTSGGGVYAGGSVVTVNDSTFVDNSSPAASQLARSAATGSVSRSLFVSDDTAQCSAPVASTGGNNLLTDASACGPGTQVARADLLLQPLQDNGGKTPTHSLAAGSAAIDAGGSACSATDQRGAARPFGSACDVGAFEIDEALSTGANFVVNAITDDGDGICGSAAGECTLRDAVFAANANSDATVISFDPTVFANTQTLTLSQGQLALTHPTSITGTGQDALVINANNASRHFLMDDGTDANASMSMSDLSLINGMASDGGALLSQENLVLSRVKIASNTSTNNGALAALATPSVNPRDWNLTEVSLLNNGGTARGVGLSASLPMGSTISINNSEFSGNARSTASGNGFGGGAFIDLNNGSITVSNSRFLNNSLDASNVTNGGGLLIRAAGSITVLDQLTVMGNRSGGVGSRGLGGGLSAELRGGSLTLSNSSVTGNTAGGDGNGVRYGGGAYLAADSAALINITDSSFSNNTAVLDGAGLVLKAYKASSITLTRATISGNTAGAGGGGVYGYSYDAGSLIEFRDSTISGNTAGTSGGGLYLKTENQSGSVSLLNTTVTANIADSDSTNDGAGGGVAMNGGATDAWTLRGSAIAGNSDRSSSAFNDIDQRSVPTQAFNSVIGDNAGTLFNEAPLATPDANNNVVGSAAGSGVIDAKLDVLMDNGGKTLSHRPLGNSPLVDRYDGCTGTDQAGRTRGIDGDGVTGNDCDVGSVEFIPKIFSEGFEDIIVVKRFEERTARLGREQLLDVLPSTGAAKLVVRATSIDRNWGLMLVHARRIGDRIELQLNRFEAGEWHQGQWTEMKGESIQLNW